MTTQELRETLVPMGLVVRSHENRTSLNVDIYSDGKQVAEVPLRLYRYVLYGAFDTLDETIQLQAIDALMEYVKTPLGGR